MDRWFDIFFRPFIKSPQKGAITIYRALTNNTINSKEAIIYKGANTKACLISKDYFQDIFGMPHTGHY